MAFKEVTYDINEIAPDAPEGAWTASIPRGKIKIQPTKEDRYPMLIIPLRLDKYEGEEEGEVFDKALGTELSLMVVFFGDEKAKAARMGKLRLRQLCEATDVDLDVVPKKITSEEDLADLVSALEGKKLPIWTKHNVRKDTGETVVDVQLQKPGGLRTAADADEGEEDERPATRKPAKKASRR
jgi:hypothetical protein